MNTEQLRGVQSDELMQELRQRNDERRREMLVWLGPKWLLAGTRQQELADAVFDGVKQ